MSESYSIFARLKAVDDGFSSTIQSASGSIGGLESRIKSGIGFGVLTGIGQKCFSTLSQGFSTLTSHIGAGIARYDTINNFPKIMQKVGFSAKESDKAIKRLTDGVDGLPTALDDVVSSAQQLALMNGDLSKSSDLAIALNDAFLASGSSSADASRGLTQYTQMMSKGKVDQQSWNTLLETMSPALTQVAKSFGYTGESAKTKLYEALKSGKVTFSDFSDQLIKLDGGVNGFAAQAKTSSTGIATSFKNIGTSVTKGIANAIKEANSTLEKQGLPTIQERLDSIKQAVNNTFKTLISSDAFKSIVSGISSAFDWIKNNVPKVISAITPYIKVLVDTAKDVGGAFKDAFSAVFDSATDMDNARSGAEKLRAALKPLADVLKAVAGVIKDHAAQIGSLISKLPALIAIVLTFKAAWKGVGTVVGIVSGVFKTVSSTISVVKSAVKGLSSVAQGAAGVFERLSGKTSSSSKTFDSMRASVKKYKTDVSGAAGTTEGFAGKLSGALGVIGLVGAGVGIAATAIYNYRKSIEDTMEKQYGLGESAKNLKTDIDNLKTSYDEMEKSRQNSFGSIDTEYDSIGTLKEQYNRLIGENGKVKTGYEDRAKAIKEKIAEILGVEVSAVDQTINKHGELSDSLDQLVEKKKLEAKLDAAYDSYVAAEQKKKEAIDAQTKAYEEMQTQMGKVQELRDKIAQVVEANRTSERPDTTRLSALQQELSVAEGGLSDLQAAYKQTSDVTGSCQTQIDNYNNLITASTKGNAKEQADAWIMYQQNLKSASSSTVEELQIQKDKTQSAWTAMQAAVENGSIKSTDVRVSEAKRANELAGAELDKAVAKAEKSGEDLPTSVKTGIDTTKQSAVDAADVTRKETQAKIDLLNGGPAGSNLVSSTAGAIMNNIFKTNNAAGNVKSGITGIFDSIANVTSAQGAPVVHGLARGMYSRKGETDRAGSNIGNSAARSMDASDRSYTSGSNIGWGLIKGMNSTINGIWNKACKLATTALTGISTTVEEGSPSKVTRRTGRWTGIGLALGMIDKVKQVKAAGQKLGNAATRSIDMGNVIAFPDLQMPKQSQISAIGKELSSGYSYGINADQTITVPLYLNDEKFAEATVSANQRAAYSEYQRKRVI